MRALRFQAGGNVIPDGPDLAAEGLAIAVKYLAAFILGLLARSLVERWRADHSLRQANSSRGPWRGGGHDIRFYPSVSPKDGWCVVDAEPDPPDPRPVSLMEYPQAHLEREQGA